MPPLFVRRETQKPGGEEGKEENHQILHLERGQNHISKGRRKEKVKGAGLVKKKGNGNEVRKTGTVGPSHPRGKKVVCTSDGVQVLG